MAAFRLVPLMLAAISLRPKTSEIKSEAELKFAVVA